MKESNKKILFFKRTLLYTSIITLLVTGLTMIVWNIEGSSFQKPGLEDLIFIGIFNPVGIITNLNYFSDIVKSIPAVFLYHFIIIAIIKAGIAGMRIKKSGITKILITILSFFIFLIGVAIPFAMVHLLFLGVAQR